MGADDAQDPLDGPPPDTGGNDQEALDGPPPDTSQHNRADLDGPATGTRSGTTVVVSAAPLDDVDDLGVRLDARFAALEAPFAAFEVRAQAFMVTDARGGHGCFREFVEAILRARGEWDALVTAPGA